MSKIVGKKLSDLPFMAYEEIDSENDYIPVIDASENDSGSRNKKITLTVLTEKISLGLTKFAYLEASSPTTVTIVSQSGFTTPVTAQITDNILTITSDGEFTTKFLRNNSIGAPNEIISANAIRCELWDNFDDFSMEIKGK